MRLSILLRDPRYLHARRKKIRKNLCKTMVFEAAVRPTAVSGQRSQNLSDNYLNPFFSHVRTPYQLKLFGEKLTNV